MDSQGGRKKIPLQSMFKEASPAALQLMDSLLLFDPEDRMNGKICGREKRKEEIERFI